ncbi:hypothetical protein CQW23_11972 [Capsicum baccatum]|uniref:Uncharacterized protein n=1 Tax=Capsicum baccatum TaxID=33114 RepID=A0A2G2WRA1_CAPBA|nr:hypothetical protein CQW23_11972 [Capsicum baccatum]
MVEIKHKPGRAELYLDTHKKEDGSHDNKVAKEICEYENGGKECPFLVVYEEMCRKKNNNGTRGDWVEPRARIVYEEFKRNIEELVKKHMPQVFHEEEDKESDDN